MIPHRFLTASFLSVIIVCACSAKANVHIDFWGIINFTFAYSLTSAGNVKVTAGNNSTSLQAGTNKFYIPAGTSSVDLTFDKPGNVTALDLSFSASGANGYNNKITGITIEGLDNLGSLNLDMNALTMPVGSVLPSGCRVNYGNQENITLEVLDGNIIDTSPYSAADWDIQWYESTRTPLAGNLVSKLDDTRFLFTTSLDYYVYATLTHVDTGFTLKTSNLACNKHMEPLVVFSTNGKGTAGTMRVESASAGITKLIASCMGVSGSDDFKITLSAGELNLPITDATLEVNFPRRINRIFMPDLGLTSICFPNGCSQLSTVDLSNNALLPSALPVELKDVENLLLATNRHFTLSPLSNGYTFDLSAEIAAGAEVIWVDENGEKLDNSFYHDSKGVFTFIKPVENITAQVSSPYFDGYTICSDPVSVDFDFQPLCTFTWQTQALFPYITVEANQNLLVKINSEISEIEKDEIAEILLSTPGETTIYTNLNSAVVILDFSNLGITALTFGDDALNLALLNLEGNSFTPLSIPIGIPEDCSVEWGQQGEIDLSGCRIANTNGMDLRQYSPWIFQWFDAATHESVDNSLYVEKPSYCFEFENIGLTYALISHSDYRGLSFSSKPLEFNLKPQTEPDEEDEEEPTILENIDGPSTDFYTLEGSLLTVGSRCTVYNIDGKRTASLQPGQAITLHGGIYILVFSECSFKIGI